MFRISRGKFTMIPVVTTTHVISLTVHFLVLVLYSLRTLGVMVTTLTG